MELILQIHAWTSTDLQDVEAADDRQHEGVSGYDEHHKQNL